MKPNNAVIVIVLSSIFLTVMGIAGNLLPVSQASSVAVTPAQDAPGPAAIAKRIGVVKAINGSAITLAPESGTEITANVQANARILRVAPGDKDLKNATPIQLPEIQVGDTIRVRGYASDDAKSITVLEVIVITHSAIDAVRDQIRQDWQKRGIGGLVDSVDSASGNVTISIPRLSGKKTIVVHTAKSTVLKRYAPDSFKFEDAKPGTLTDIKPGDQLNARGNRNADGSEVTAEEIVTGVFPRFAGTIKSIDASAGTLSVQDLLSKKTVQVRIAADSQLHKIPNEIAQGFAARIKSTLPMGMPGGGGGQTATSSTPPAGGTPPAQGGSPSGGGAWQGSRTGGNGGGAPGGGARSGAPDLQQMLARLPASTLADLHLQKGDAVVILGTGGTPSTAITLLSGVEPILQAAPNASQAMMLTPWSLGGAPGGDQ